MSIVNNKKDVFYWYGADTAQLNGAVPPEDEQMPRGPMRNRKLQTFNFQCKRAVS